MVYQLTPEQVERNRSEADRQLEAGEISFNRAVALHAALAASSTRRRTPMPTDQTPAADDGARAEATRLQVELSRQREADELDAEYGPAVQREIERNDGLRAGDPAAESDEVLGERVEGVIRDALRRVGRDPGLATGIVDRVFMRTPEPSPATDQPAPIAPDDWLATLRHRLDNPQPGDDPDSLRAMIAEATPRRFGSLPADIALPVAALLRAVARRIEARAC